VPFEADVVKFVRQLVEGLAYLHDRKIAHLDIKVCHDYHPSVAFPYFVKENRPYEAPIQDTWDKTMSFYPYISSIMVTESSAGCVL